MSKLDDWEWVRRATDEEVEAEVDKDLRAFGWPEIARKRALNEVAGCVKLIAEKGTTKTALIVLSCFLDDMASQAKPQPSPN